MRTGRPPLVSTGCGIVGQHVTSGWSAEWSQAGAVVTARGVAWNKDIAPGQTLHIGFNGTNTGADLTPARFLINGAACS
ncbi:cellulose binding domain-containing protein [Microtetraspora glauca]|uniref:Cellulose binding domain-containing protein n=1 Tax=Microtetraspora glauca TaxID=1996 RepID=A0ABV3GT53_MICGL